MNKHSLIKGIFVGAGIVISLVVLLRVALPELYLYSENSNFEKLRKKSELDCQTMLLHCLVRDENISAITQYVSDGKDIELKDNWGRTALFWALMNSKQLIMNKLLDLKADPNTKDENGISIFYQSIAWNNYGAANDLLERGADIDAFNGNQYPETSLHFCVMKNKPQCVRYLLENGANIYLRDSFGYTVFERVKVHDHIDKEISNLVAK